MKIELMIAIAALASCAAIAQPSSSQDTPSGAKPSGDPIHERADQRTKITRKVLVLNIDPILEAHNGVRLNEHLRWNDPRKMNADYLRDLSEASGGYVQWELLAWVDLDLWPRKKDGFRYDDSTYLECWNNREAHPFHQPDAVDYDAILDLKLPTLGNRTVHELAADGSADEIIVWAHPYSGFYESRMIGKTAYWCNSPPIKRDSRLYVLMNLNPEREVALALHSFGHRAESILTHVYGSWSGNSKVAHLWDRFTRVKAKHHTDIAGVGNIHFPPNATNDYDYGNNAEVSSEADTWLKFPDLSATTTMINSAAWGGPDYQLGYMRWWFSRLPKAPGRYVDPQNPVNDGKLNNWWAYIVDMDAYAESR